MGLPLIYFQLFQKASISERNRQRIARIMYSFSIEEVLLCYQQKENVLMHINKEVPVSSRIIMALLGVCCTVTMDCQRWHMPKVRTPYRH